MSNLGCYDNTIVEQEKYHLPNITQTTRGFLFPLLRWFLVSYGSHGCGPLPCQWPTGWRLTFLPKSQPKPCSCNDCILGGTLYPNLLRQKLQQTKSWAFFNPFVSQVIITLPETNSSAKALANWWLEDAIINSRGCELGVKQILGCENGMKHQLKFFPKFWVLGPRTWNNYPLTLK